MSTRYVKVADMLDQVPLEDRDTKGDLYEYMLGKIASAGQNGQFRNIGAIGADAGGAPQT